MIKSHKPRGYLWNCASEFQQTPEFRNIRFDECLAPVTPETLILADLEFAPAERAAKRRRIEKLADDFMNGIPLDITAARTNTSNALDRVCRSFSTSRTRRAALAGTSSATSDTYVWEDVEDEWEILRARASTFKSAVPGIQLVASVSTKDYVGSTTIQDHARTNCQSGKPSRRVHLRLEPSEDALRRAKELCCRKLQGVITADASDVSQPTRHSVSPACGLPSESSVLLNTDSIENLGPVPTQAWTSSKWIESGLFQLRQKRVDEDCSRDELGASSIDTSAVHPRSLGITLLPPRSDVVSSSLSKSKSSDFHTRAQHSSACPIPTECSIVVQEELRATCAKTSLASAQSGNGLKASKTSLHVVDDAVNERGSVVPEVLEGQGDSQDQLLQARGIRARPRKTWTSMNDVHKEVQLVNAEIIGNLATGQEVIPSATRDSIQESARSTGRKKSKAKPRKSAAALLDRQLQRRSTRRKSEPWDSQTATEQSAELPVDETSRETTFSVKCSVPMGSHASPFEFHRRALKCNVTDQPTKDPPMLEMKMTDRFLNSILPTDHHFGSSSSTVRRAIHDEFVTNGAEISRLPGCAVSSQLTACPEKPISPLPSSNTGAVTDVTMLHAELARDTQWPGTQDMLIHAQKHLFTSPNEVRTPLHPEEESNLQSMSRSIGSRQPLSILSLSQEQAVSTQVIYDKWKAFSTTKKLERSCDSQNGFDTSPSLGKGSCLFDASSNNRGGRPPCEARDETTINRRRQRTRIRLARYIERKRAEQPASGPIVATDERRQSHLRFLMTRATASVATPDDEPSLSVEPDAPMSCPARTGIRSFDDALLTPQGRRDSTYLKPTITSSLLTSRLGLATTSMSNEVLSDLSFQAAQDPDVLDSSIARTTPSAIMELDSQTANQNISDLVRDVLSTEDVPANSQ